MNDGYFALQGEKLKGTFFPEFKQMLNDQNTSTQLGL